MAAILLDVDGVLQDGRSDVDRPLVKSDGSYTYFAADIAYHRNKFLRGRKVAHAITERAKRFNKCCSEGFIIVNDRN